MYSKMLSTVLSLNGHKIVEWCAEREIRPSDLYFLDRKGEKYTRVRRDLKKELRKAKPKIESQMAELESL